MTNPSNPTRIRELNDTLRRTFSPVHGRVVITAGIDALPPATKRHIIEHVQAFEVFTPDNDPHQEHDFGSFEVDGCKVFWKVDLYEEPEVKSENEKPVASRVLTIMLAAEY